MRYAISLARRGEGWVEPNPMVGAVVVDQDWQKLGEGWHQQYGGPHAEVHALREAGERTKGQTLIVTLEPCCHFGKTPPCSRAVIAAGIRRVIVGLTDPNPQVAGGGIRELQAAGIEVETGLLRNEIERLNAPFLTMQTRQRPYVLAKWAMTWDGKIAAATGESQWISGPESRARVHQLRGRVDAILVGRMTAERDDPQLTARPPGPRTAVRVVVDSQARLSVQSHLVRTARETPVLVCCAEQAPADRIAALQASGVQIERFASGELEEETGRPSVAALLRRLAARRVTNLLVEGGGELLGAFHDAHLIDEVHLFLCPGLMGGRGAISPAGGHGVAHPRQMPRLTDAVYERSGEDWYCRSRVDWSPQS